jgi:predicted nucleotidyltransferase
MDKNLYNYLKALKQNLITEGFELVGVFGSHGRGSEDIYSDLDIAYKIDHDQFHKDNAFKKLLRINEIKREIELQSHKKVDIVPLTDTILNNIDQELILL